MKQCPNCSQTYSMQDTYCYNDGGVLIEISNSGHTPNHVSNEMPTQVISPPQVTSSMPEKKSSILLYTLIGLMGVIILGMAIFIFLPKDSETSSAKTKEKFESVESSKKKSYSADDDKDDSPKSYTGDIDASKIEMPPPTPTRPTISPKGRWSGDWSSPSGAYLTVVFDLIDDGTGNINGQINWTLRKTNRPEKMSKIGMSAVEYVRGSFDSNTQRLRLKGYRKDDPNGVLVMTDDYRLNLSKNNQSLNGNAKNGGKWDGRINLSR